MTGRRREVPPKPSGWKPAATVDEAIARTRERNALPPLDLDDARLAVDERLAIRYVDRPSVRPVYEVRSEGNGVRVFREMRSGEWKSAFAARLREIPALVDWLESMA